MQFLFYVIGIPHTSCIFGAVGNNQEVVKRPMPDSPNLILTDGGVRNRSNHTSDQAIKDMVPIFKRVELFFAVTSRRF